ncbi:Hsp33 family molecular chaperone HslO [Idiomarina xiamenensis]|uniref:33 kDa chaperonin n=1 Tax=Idiomarina xiamenensis 10-D-4 TaxID=740709 RepID=K2KBQ5_9GAMM|nr:Hsp33 family molecular chaperone HslO [Idiomarina xiamenensis]EKE85223.1 Hsp33-like chaperonin [Idiomarina xiamenensis 10-D-4]
MTYLADQLLRYTFTDQDVRGELVQLTSSYQKLIQGHDYPPAVQRLLGEMLAVTSLLTATLKFEGHINLQLQGSGALNYVAINGDHLQQLRGVARVRGELPSEKLSEMLGKGQLLITITPLNGERYQGVVAAEGDSLAAMVENYFAQSEQLHTRLWLHSDSEHAAGMMLQVLPAAGKDLTAFEHLETLTDTISEHELYTLPGEQLLHRLYHQEQVLLYPAHEVSFVCGCSRDKSLDALASVSNDELREILDEEGKLVMTCDYCLTDYIFTAHELGLDKADS